MTDTNNQPPHQGNQPEPGSQPMGGQHSPAMPPPPPAPPAPPAGMPPQAPQQYPQQYQQGNVHMQQAPAQAPLNVLSLVAFIGSFFINLVGIICGHIALSQIKKTGERGRGFALAGLIIGYVSIALTLLWIILLFAGLAAAGPTYVNELEELQNELDQMETY